MNPSDIELALKVGGLVFAAGGAWTLLRATSRKADVAHTRIDALETAGQTEAVRRAQWEGHMDSGLTTLLKEVDRVRMAVHDGRSENSGMLGKIENEIEELKDRFSEFRERVARGER